MSPLQSKTSHSFRTCFQLLPRSVREQAFKQFALFRDNPAHPSLRLKQIHSLWCVRASRSYRAVAVREGNTYTWLRIGPHDEYEAYIARMVLN